MIYFSIDNGLKVEQRPVLLLLIKSLHLAPSPGFSNQQTETREVAIRGKRN